MPEHTVAQYTNADAQGTVKANVEVGDLKAPTKALDMNAQKVEDIAAPTAANDAVRKAYADLFTLLTTFNTHEAAATGIHGAGASTLATVANIATHAALATHLVSGLINMWHGTIATIPSGWVICDGNNSTPNLLTRFIEGVATAATNPGATGGATSKSHVSHTHTMPTHTHEIRPDGQCAYATGNTCWAAPTGNYSEATDPGDTNAKTVSAHSDIRPLFYDIAFLMKT